MKNRARQQALTLSDLIAAIEHGQTIIPAVMDGTKASDWREQQLFMVDIDNSASGVGLLTPEGAVRICAANGITPVFYYHTFSHTDAKPKFRLAFLMDEVVREEAKRKAIMEGLIGLFEQADPSCKNADRLFFGTDKKVVMVDETARVSLPDIYGLCRPPTAQQQSHNPELDELKREFDLFTYMKQRNGECREIGRGYMFKDCEICGHHDDLVYYSDNNSFYCFGANGGKGGSIIDYIMLSEKVDTKTAIHRLYELSGKPYPALEEWQTPIPFDNFNLPAFPIGAIPSPFREFIEAVAEDTQTPVDMPAMSVLGVAAVTVQGKLQVEGKPGYVEPLNIYALIIAKPAARKSGVNQATTAVLYEYEKQKNKEIEPKMREQETQLQILQSVFEKTIKRGDGEEATTIALQIQAIEDDKISPFRLITSDSTPEALTTLLHENGGRMAILSAEGGIFTTLAGQYNKNIANIETVLKAHAGDAIRVDRMNRESQSIDHPCLTMVVCLQDSVIHDIFANEQFKGRGLVARMLFCKPVSTVGKRRYDTTPIPPETKQAYEDAVLHLLEYPDADDRLQLSDEAQVVSREWFCYLEPLHADDLEAMGDWSGKLHGATLRIAGLLHCMAHWSDLKDNLVISASTMENAVRIGRYLLEHAKWAYSVMGADVRAEKAKYVLKKILKSGQRVLSRRELMRLCRSDETSTVDKLTPALTLLMEYGYIRSVEQEPVRPGCKPNILYEVNPCVTNVTDVTGA